MDFLKKILLKSLLPFVAYDWYLNLLIKIPQVTVGAILAFHFGPRSFGMPWSDKNLNLDFFEVSSRFVAIAENFYEPIASHPYLFGIVSGVIKCFGGILLILGLGTRIISLCIVILMTIFLLNSHAFEFNYIYPLFFISVGCFALYFGSGKYGIDYLLSPKDPHPDIELDDFM